MRRVDLIATTAHIYGGKRLARGDYFTASYQDAQLLKAIKRAKDAPPPDYSYLLQNYTADLKPKPHLLPKSAEYETAHMEADTGPSHDSEPDEAYPLTTRRRRQYRRRQMTAKP